MRVTILTVGSRGDVQPYVALGLGLQAAGHQVRLATHVEFEPFVREHGLDFAVIPNNPFTGLNAGVEPGAADAANAPDTTLTFRQRFEQALEQWITGSLAASQDAEAIIYSQLCFIGYYVAEKLQVPCYAANHSPLTPTRVFPTIYARKKWRLGGAFNRLTHFLDQQFFWQRNRTMLNRLRQQTLGLPPLPFWGPYGRMQRERLPVLYGYSPALVPKPFDWDDWIHVTGFWFLDRPAAWQPPDDLVAFLEAGPPPVYLGLGSVANSNPVRVTKAALEALAQTGQRVIVMPGRVDLAQVDLPPETYRIGPTHFDWLFPRVAAVITHGGPGTVGLALRAGVPALAIPFFGDQFFWGQRIADLGVGPAPIPAAQASVEQAAAAVRTMVGDQAMRRRAADLGRQIQAEDGVARAVEVLQQHQTNAQRAARMEVAV
jgi:UDP:flavonoid glycosyltransferase YjiC (YdhE family)